MKIINKLICFMLFFTILLNEFVYACDCEPCDCSHTCSGGNVGARIADGFELDIKNPNATMNYYQFYELGKKNEGVIYAPEQVGIEADVFYYGDEDGDNSGSVKPFKIGSIMYGYNDGDYKRNGKDNKGSSGNAIKEGSERATYQANNMGEVTYYPFIKMRYATLDNTSMRPAIMFSENTSTINSFMVAQTAVKNPGNITIGVDSMWDGWTKTMDGLNSTGILAANGDDKNVVVHGGSTMFLYTADSKTDAKLENIPFANIGIEAYVFAMPDELAGTTISGTFYTVSEAEEALKNFVEDAKNNIGHYRITKRVAEGIYRQGEEAAFVQNSELVGCNSNIRTTNRFGSFNGTAGNGKGNKLDYIHSKYYFNDYIEDDRVNENSDNITVKCDYDITEFKISSDIDESNADSVIHTYHFSTRNVANESEDDSISKISDTFDKESSTNTGNLKPNNKSLEWKLGGNVSVGKEEGWKDLNYITGFVDNYINSLDLHEEGNTSNARSCGETSEPNTRNNSRRYWYSEGQDGMSVLRLQAHFYLYLDTRKWEVMDPALCGQAKSHYDLRNWSDNDNDGKVDINIKSIGALKDKVRTFRYELSPYFVYNDGDDANNGSSEAQNGETVGEKFYLGTIGDSSLKDGDEKSLPVYLNNMNSVLSSKLMYIDNATVQDSNN